MATAFVDLELVGKCPACRCLSKVTIPPFTPKGQIYAWPAKRITMNVYWVEWFIWSFHWSKSRGEAPGSRIVRLGSLLMVRLFVQPPPACWDKPPFCKVASALSKWGDQPSHQTPKQMAGQTTAASWGWWGAKNKIPKCRILVLKGLFFFFKVRNPLRIWGKLQELSSWEKGKYIHIYVYMYILEGWACFRFSEF